MLSRLEATKIEFEELSALRSGGPATSSENQLNDATACNDAVNILRRTQLHPDIDEDSVEN